MDVKELKEKNGKEGKPSYVVYKNQVYDVTDSKLWKNGVHVNRHNAGQDLTEFMSMAPHGPEVFERVKQVGTITNAPEVKDNKELYRKLYSKYHPHPILIHNPMGVLPFGFLLLLLYFATGIKSFESASYYALIFGTICSYPAVASGILSWYINYQKMMTRIFSIKLYLSIVVLILSTTAVFLHLSFQEISSNNGMSIAYCLCYLAIMPCLFTVAYNGGKITWPS